MSLKSEIIDGIIRTEGGYINDASDSGGETNFGITKVVARSFGYDGEMIDLPRQVAFDIYSAKYWDSLHGDDLLNMSAAIAAEVIDTGVNMGTKRAATFLQRSLNVFNDRGRLYSDIVVDGIVGQATLSALSSYGNVRDEDVLIKMLNCLQGSFYVVLAERREKDEKFINGWFKNRVSI